MSIDYTQKVLENFMNPRNMGKIENPDGVGIAGNIACGDEMKVYIKVSARGGSASGGKDEIISDVKFEALGCAAAIATSSMITELAMGKTLDEATKISRVDVAEELGGLPPIKMHCSNMAAEALHRAIENYRNKPEAQNPKSETN